MAQRRMFSKKITTTDAFLDMPLSSQVLYFHLAMEADDDGFVSNPKKIMRMLGCQEDDYKILIAKRFVIVFENGICVIKHWKIHNYLQKDRYIPTVYTEELAKLTIKDNNSYTECIQNGRLGKDSIGKVRIGKVISEQSSQKTLSQQIEPLTGQYAPSMIIDFTLYWEETDTKGTPRWKKEKTWDIKKRLERWKRQQEKWDYEKEKRNLIKTLKM